MHCDMAHVIVIPTSSGLETIIATTPDDNHSTASPQLYGTQASQSQCSWAASSLMLHQNHGSVVHNGIAHSGRGESNTPLGPPSARPSIIIALVVPHEALRGAKFNERPLLQRDRRKAVQWRKPKLERVNGAILW